MLLALCALGARGMSLTGAPNLQDEVDGAASSAVQLQDLEYVLPSPVNLTDALLKHGSLTLLGPATLTSSADARTQLLNAIVRDTPGLTLTLRNLELRNGLSTQIAGALEVRGLDRVILENCTFDGNEAIIRNQTIEASLTNEYPLGGGAIHLTDVPEVQLSRTTFSHNKVVAHFQNYTGSRAFGLYGASGGAATIFYTQQPSKAVNISIDSCVFLSNMLNGTGAEQSFSFWGGAIWIGSSFSSDLKSPSIWFSQSNFSLNSAVSNTSCANGGAAAVHFNGNVTRVQERVSQSSFVGNMAKARQGPAAGAYVSTVGGPWSKHSHRNSTDLSFSVQGCRFENNVASLLGGQVQSGSGDPIEGGLVIPTASAGALLRSFFGHVNVSNCTIVDTVYSNNTATSEPGSLAQVYGGAYYTYINSPAKTDYWDYRFGVPKKLNITITHARCKFVGNSVSSPGDESYGTIAAVGSTGSGGAVALANAAIPDPIVPSNSKVQFPKWPQEQVPQLRFVDHCLMEGNSASCPFCAGGAVSVVGAALITSDITMSNNSARFDGGAVYAQDSLSSFKATRTEFDSNEEFRLKKIEKYGSKDGYEQFLQKKLEKKFNDTV